MKNLFSANAISPVATLLFLVWSGVARADYPLFWQRYTADPWAVEYGGRIYIYCSHDTYDASRGYGYFMNDITCISSDDLKNWTDHGEVFSASDTKWGATFTWAPCVVERDDKFYLYYGDGGDAIGVAVAEDPTGPFFDNNDAPLVSRETPGVMRFDPDGNPVKNSPDVRGALDGSEQWGMWCFDPSVLIDDDGSAYLYFGGAHPDNSRIIRLADDLTSVVGEAFKADTPGFFEASCVHKYGGKYYYSYSGHYYNVPANIEYVASDRPDEGFSAPRVVMNNPPVNDGFNHHHCIFSFGGDWYMAYHNRQLAYENNESDARAREYMRSVCLDRLFYADDGSIIPVAATRDGLPQLKNVDAFAWNEAETMAKCRKIGVVPVGDGKNRAVKPAGEGAFVEIRGVDFGAGGRQTFIARTACEGTCSGSVELRLQSPEGLLVGMLPLSDESGGAWRDLSASVDIPAGVFDLFLVFRDCDGAGLLLDAWRFVNYI